MMTRRIEIELLKVVDAGHFQARPIAKPGSEYESFMGQLNDYFQCGKGAHSSGQSVIPLKGKKYAVKRTMDKCWYRARIQNIMSTTCGPQASVSLVDVGETTLVPYTMIQELPPEFENIPFQAMDCFLTGVKPLNMVTSYFDLTTTKQVCDHWSEAATNFVITCTRGCRLYVQIQGEDERGSYQVLLHAESSLQETCINDDLVQREFAVFSAEPSKQEESPSKAERRRIMQENFQRQQQEIVNAFMQSANLTKSEETTSTDDESYSFQSRSSKLQSQTHQRSSLDILKQQVAGIRESMSSNLSAPVARIPQGNAECRLTPQAVPSQDGHEGSQVPNMITTEQWAPVQGLHLGIEDSRVAHIEYNYPQSFESHSGRETLTRKPYSESADVESESLFASRQQGNVTQNSQDTIARDTFARKPYLLSSQGQATRTFDVQDTYEGVPLARMPDLLSSRKEECQPTSLFDRLHEVGSTPQITNDRNTSDRKPFSFSNDEEPGRVRFMSARLPATGKGEPSISTTQNMTSKLKPILKKNRDSKEWYSSGSSSDQEARTRDVRTTARQYREPSQNSAFPSKTSHNLISTNASNIAACFPTLSSQTEAKTTLQLPSELLLGSPKSITSETDIHNGVLIHGESAPQPFLSMDKCPFYEFGPRLGIKYPSPIQRHFWPALLRGRDVAGVSPHHSGKRLAYLLPIIAQVLEPSAYSELPLTNGPLALVLCYNWQNALRIYNECKEIVKSRMPARVQVIFGGGAEEEQIVPLINGCEILVATPPCFLRLLKRSYTTLDRLCHIVFDDADFLVEDFTAEVKEIMRLYGRLLVSQPGRMAPRQATIMSSSWTVGVASLVRAYLGNPLVIIADKVEASIFAGVQQAVNVCSLNTRLGELVGFLDNIKSTHEVVVFTFTTDEAMKLGDFLKAHNHYVLVAHEFLQPQQLTDIKREWNTPHSGDSMPILVMTDGVIAQNHISIQNASVVIHYDFPLANGKQKFGERIHCMSLTYSMSKEHGCVSVIFITENCIRQATIAHQLLSRTAKKNTTTEIVQNQSPEKFNFGISPLLEQIVEVAQQAKEERKKHMDLCHFLMAYGACRAFQDKRKCVMRHVIIKDADYPHNIPTSGTVKILVLHVMCASCLWVRILEHRDPKGVVIPCKAFDSTQFLEMTMDMGLWYANESNRIQQELPKVSDLCALEDGGTYYRVKVCEVTCKVSQSGMASEVEVQFVDQGTFACIKVERLLHLPSAFCSLPFQAVQVFVCRVKPLDKDQHWTMKANNTVKNMVEGKELEGKVVLSLGNTMWLDPLLERRVLKNINVTTNLNNIRLELLKQELATENKQHVKNLKSLCEDIIDLSIYDGTTGDISCDSSASLETAVLEEEGFQDVYISAVENPALFFIQLMSSTESLDDLRDKIDGGVASVDSSNEEIAIGLLCLACFTIDDKWYRARVLGMRCENEYDVFYVDYGDREWVTRDRIKPVWADILRLPLQAIECSLVNVSPLENDWSVENSDAFWDMTKDKLLVAKVKSKGGSLVSGCHRFVVELFDTSTIHDIVISQELVAVAHAQTSPEGIQTLFPDAVVQFELQEYEHEYEKIPKMCLQILKSRDYSQKLDIAKSLQTIVMNSTSAKDAIREYGGISCLCRLLVLTRAPVVQEHLLVSLDCLTFQNESNCEEARRAGGLKTLCYLLEKSTNTTVQERVAWTLKNVSATERNKDTVRELGGIKILCNVLKTAIEDKLQEHIAWALEVLATDNNKNCKMVFECGGVQSLCSLVTHSTNQHVLERTTRALAALAPEPNNRNCIRQYGGLEAICKKVQDHPGEEFLRIGMGTLKTLVNNNQHNRDIMRDLGMITTLQAVHSAPQRYSSITRRLCSDLLQRLVGWAASGMLMTPITPGTAPSLVNGTQVTKQVVHLPVATCKLGFNGLEDSDDDNMPPLEGPDEEEDTKCLGAFVQPGNSVDLNRTKNKKELKVSQGFPFTSSQARNEGEQKKTRRMPQRTQLIHAKPIEKSTNNEDSGVDEGLDSVCVHPFTAWSQTKDMVRIAVRLRGVKKQQTELHDNAVHFRTKMQGKSYQLDLELYDGIITKESKVHVKGAEVLIILKKTAGTAWPRLLKTKDKLPYITIDFDRWEVWSSSEEEDTLKKKPVKLVTPKLASAKGKKTRVILPEMDTSGSSSTESDENDFDDVLDPFLKFD